MVTATYLINQTPEGSQALSGSDRQQARRSDVVAISVGYREGEWAERDEITFETRFGLTQAVSATRLGARSLSPTNL
jgi:hypothetical protein